MKKTVHSIFKLSVLTLIISPAYANLPSSITIIKPVKYGTSKPLREIVPPTQLNQKKTIPLHHIPMLPQKPSSLPDFALQASQGSTFNVTLLKTFYGVGVGLGNYSPKSIPPDTNGAAGLTQYVQWVNTDFAVFSKVTGKVLYGPVPGNTLWKNFGGPCETTNNGDAIVKYDQLANRWIMTQFAFDNPNTPPFYQCVAVSTTSDATGSYHLYEFQFSNFNDYPKLGIWPDAYYMTFNMFNASTGNFLGPQACALDRKAMLAGQSASMQCTQQNTTLGSLLPADLDGTTLPPANTAEYLLDFNANNQLEMWKYHVDWVSPNNSSFKGPIIVLNVSPFTPACSGGACIQQPFVSDVLDSLGDRLMYRLAYRQFADHGSMIVNHSVKSPSASSGIRWYQIDIQNNNTNAPTIIQQGTFSPDTKSRWMGSIAMDKVGNIGVGYSVSSQHYYPSIILNGHAVTDPCGTLGNETVVIAGKGSQTDSDPSNSMRWGDYTSMAIDPVDNCTFWYTNEYLNTTGSFNWSTRIFAFKFSNCS